MPENSSDFPRTDTLKIRELNMLEIVGEYDDPATIPEWAWIREHASFTHVGNDKEDGVYEFMIHLGRLKEEDSLLRQVPEKLWLYFSTAAVDGCVWLMFHQG